MALDMAFCMHCRAVTKFRKRGGGLVCAWCHPAPDDEDQRGERTQLSLATTTATDGGGTR